MSGVLQQNLSIDPAAEYQLNNQFSEPLERNIYRKKINKALEVYHYTYTKTPIKIDYMISKNYDKMRNNK